MKNKSVLPRYSFLPPLRRVGSCVTTLGIVTFVVGGVTDDKDIDVDDEGILVTSISFPLPLSLRAGSCVATF